MKTPKPFLRIIYCLAGLILLLSLGFNILQHRQFKNYSPKTAPEKTVNTVLADNSGSGQDIKPVKSYSKTEKSDTGRINELENYLDGAKEELDMINDQLSEELVKKEEFKKSYNQFGRDYSDPEFKKIRREAIINNINKSYTPLFKKLNISSEQFDELKGLLFDKNMEMDELTADYSNASTAEEKEEVLKREKEISARHKDIIAEFLGTQKNETFQHYENSRMERIRLSEFLETIPPENRISEEQRENLIDSMYEARNEVYAGIDTRENEDSSPGLTEEKIALNMKILTQVHKRYVETISGAMPAEQTKAYKNYLKQQREIQEASLKMSLYLNND